MGIDVDIGSGRIELRRLVLDLNGTIACDGILLPGIEERIDALRGRLAIQLVSGDSFGTAATVGRRLGVPVVSLDADAQGVQKRDVIKRIGRESVVVIGNGCNDALALEIAALGICVIGPEGAAAAALRAADIVVGSAASALDLLVNPIRLRATLRP